MHESCLQNPEVVATSARKAAPELQDTLLRTTLRRLHGTALVRTPIIVSDSSGPLPRLSLSGEFGEWGSDRPAGTRIETGPENRVEVVEAIQSTASRAKPRLAVALDFRHWLDKAIFDEIETFPFDKRKPLEGEHGLVFRFDDAFPIARVQLQKVVLYSKATVAAPWEQIFFHLQTSVAGNENRERRFALDTGRSSTAQFRNWLLFGPKSGRFGSFHFSLRDTELQSIYDTTGPWNIELDRRPAHTNFFWSSEITCVILAKGGHDKESPREVVDAPSFKWRQQFRTYQ